jgi:hypothetical protein
MPVFHLTFKFSTSQHGWVEQLYLSSQSFQSALNAGVALAQARYSILGAGVTLWQVRVTQPGYPRAYATSGLLGQTLATPAMIPQTGAEIALQGGVSPTRSRSYFLRGLPQGAILNPLGPSRWAPQWSAAILRWLNLLTQGWLMKIRDPVGGQMPLDGLALFAIEDRDFYGDPLNPTDPMPGTTFVVAQTSGAVVPVTEFAHVSQVALAPNLVAAREGVIGERLMVSNQGRQVIFSGDFGAASYHSGGVLQPVSYSYVPISSVFLKRQGSRKVGPPTSTIPPPAPLPTQLVGVIAPPAAPVPPVFASGGAPAPPPPPPYTTIQTARDLVALLYESYVSESNPEGDLVAIAQVVTPNALLPVNWPTPIYLVLISGFDRMRADSLIQEFALIGTQIGVGDPLTSFVATTIRQYTPDGCGLIFVGDSMGGTQCEWMLSWTTNLGSRRVLNIVTYGAPVVTVLNSSGINICRFANPLDPVPYLSPLGYWAWVRFYTAYFTLGASVLVELLNSLRNPYNYNYLDPEPIGADPYRQHTEYDRVLALGGWNALGYPDPGRTSPPLVIGQILRFPPTPPP